MRGSSACRVTQAAAGVSSTWPLWNGIGAVLQVGLSPGAVEAGGRLAHQLGAEVGVLLAPGLEVGAHQHPHARPPGVWTRVKGSRGQGE